MRNPVGDLLWSRNIAQGNLHYLTRVEGFWKQVLEYWSELHYCAPVGAQEVKDTIIWFNSDVRVQSRPVFYRTFYEVGVNQISDLLSDGKKFLTYDQFCSKYAFNPSFMQYYGLIEVIPEQWKIQILLDKVNRSPQVPLHLRFPNEKRLTHLLYRQISHTSGLLENHLLRWKVEIPNLEYDMFAKQLNNIVKISNYVKLRSFQYKFLLGATITNLHLKRYKIRVSDACTFCSNSIETLKHLFFDCEHVKPLWEWYAYKCAKEPTWENIVLLSMDADPKRISNCIALIIKYFIYVAHCQELKPSVTSCVIYCKNIKTIEEEVARLKQKQTIHHLK